MTYRPGGLTRRGRIVAWIASVTTVVFVATSLAAYAGYRKLNANLHVTDVFHGLRHRPPASKLGVLNILLLGSQTRDGQGRGFGTDPGTDLSDTSMLVHLSANHRHAVVISIPRDLLVYRPACKARVGTGTVQAQQGAMIDSAMSVGGPTCAVATFEDLTGIRIDHFIRMDFNGFRKMVDALGGVEVCLRQPVNDPFSHLHLGKGLHLVTGDQALAFVRTRHGVGNGGDLGRIELQQEFLSSLATKIESTGTLTNPVRLYQLADAATQSLTLDPGLGSVSKLVSLAASLRSLRTKDITFITMPNVVDPADPNRLLAAEPQSDEVWQLLRSDQPWSGHLPQPAKPVPGQVKVVVLNGAGTAGLAAATATELRHRGFDVVSTGNAAAAAATTITYATAQTAQANTLAGAVSGSPQMQAGGAGAITLTIGADWAGLQAVSTSRTAATPPAPLQTRTASQNICSGIPLANPNA
jgi:LCP family protein required for cell wall assembly